MAAADDDFKLGFLSTVALPGGGFVGGLLVTNRHGRPLEFQCTTPVKPTKSQEILFGEMLQPYLLGEVIAETLVRKAAVKPDIVLTEDDAVLEVRSHIDKPAGLVFESPAQDADSIQVGRQRLRFHDGHRSDRDLVSDRAAAIHAAVDMTEPFRRVREALEETAKASATR
ncbi:hypothetical protein [Stratiformator vulcanicus]|uniref:Uncharacterized protein n=1 Tax=Stratiformator vulcanicus TaxID=2527980 RepID=A0A517R6T6_9PLAN|nr:hypothetical protein [Stratiformator vulcanicus]QDT39589.1 hypothetical protein Pan189_39980 [Stratiformator vulcanicus]